MTESTAPALSFDARYDDLAVDLIVPNPDQPRKLFDQEALDELAASIQVNGLLQPIVVRQAGEDTRCSDTPYMIIAGERRWRAAKQAGLTHLPCRVLANLDDETSFVLSILENVNRKDMTPSEEAKAFQQLVNTGKTVDEVARLFGKTSEYVNWRMGILGLSERHLRYVDDGVISITLAFYVAKLSRAGQQIAMNKAARGEFRTWQEGTAFCQALEAQERQGFFMEVQEMVEQQSAKRAVAEPASTEPSDLDALLLQLAEVTDKLAAMVPASTKPRDLAGRMGLDAVTLAEYLDDLNEKLLPAKRITRKAAAIVEVAQAKADAEAAVAS